MIISSLPQPSQIKWEAMPSSEPNLLLDSLAISFNILDMASAYGIFAAQGVRYGQPGLITVLRVEGQDHSVGSIKATRRPSR